MNNAVLEDDALAPELMLPAQFREIWHGARLVSPEMLLALSVLGQAANDLQMYRFAHRRRNQRLYSEAYHWVASNERSWPYSFANLCDELQLSAESVRAHLLGDAPALAPPQLRDAARAGSRTASDGRGAMVFRLSRAPNIKPMALPRPTSARGRRRVAS